MSATVSIWLWLSVVKSTKNALQVPLGQPIAFIQIPSWF